MMISTNHQETPAARCLAIGDIHGCDSALERLIDELSPSSQDTVVVLGDVVDRGPNSRQVIDRLLELAGSCQLKIIQGNHDEIMRQALSGNGFWQAWMDKGGTATLKSYGGQVENIPSTHIRFLLEMLPFHETTDHLFVHAKLEPQVSMKNQTSDYLRWKKLSGSEAPHFSGKRVVCGHTSQKDGSPLVFPGWVCIDTFAHGGGWLSCLDVQSDQLYQATQSGSFREIPLHEAAG